MEEHHDFNEYFIGIFVCAIIDIIFSGPNMVESRGSTTPQRDCYFGVTVDTFNPSCVATR